MSILFSQKLRLTMGFATLLLISLASSYLYTQSQTKQLAQKYSNFSTQRSGSSSQAVRMLSTGQENAFIAQQTSYSSFHATEVHQDFVSPAFQFSKCTSLDRETLYQNIDRQDLVLGSTSYPVIDELQNYKFSVQGSDILTPGKLPTAKVDFNQADLLTVLVNTRKYFQNYANQDPQVLRTGLLGTQGITVQDIVKTLDFMSALLREDIANSRATRLQDSNFINTNFRVIKWSAYNPQNPNQQKLRITKYAVFTHPGSHTKTSTFNIPIYSLKSNPSTNKFYTKYTKQDVLSGIYEPGGKEQGKVETIAYLTRNGLEEALMEGTILVNFTDGSKAFFNVDRSNEMSYIRGLPATEQKRYWYFKQVDAIKGYGYKIDAKISILPGVTFAGDVLNIGLGKVIMTESTQDGHKHLQLGVIADTGGAFLPNLHQLDFLAGIFQNQKDFEQHSKQLPDYVTAYILVKK